MPESANLSRLRFATFDLTPWLPGPVIERPMLELRESTDAFELEAELDGLRAEGLRLRAASRVFDVEGRYLRRHWCPCAAPSQLSFSRRFHLGGPVEVERIEASFDGTQLRVRIPKSRGAPAQVPLREIPLRECA